MRMPGTFSRIGSRRAGSSAQMFTNVSLKESSDGQGSSFLQQLIC